MLQAREAPHSLSERLDATLLKSLNIDIIERENGNLATIYLNHRLRHHGVSRSAFYRYAKRFRNRVSLIEAVELADPEDENTVDRLPQLIAQMIESLTMDPDVDPRRLYRMAAAYRIVAKTSAFIRESSAKSSRAKSKAQAASSGIDRELLAETRRLLAQGDKIMAAANLQPAPSGDPLHDPESDE